MSGQWPAQDLSDHTPDAIELNDGNHEIVRLYSRFPPQPFFTSPELGPSIDPYSLDTGLYQTWATDDSHASSTSEQPNNLHQTRLRQLVSKGPQPVPPITGPTKARYCCPNCPKQYNDRSSLNRHERDDHKKRPGRNGRPKNSDKEVNYSVPGRAHQS
ncbi:hypothetical protein BJY04DRAFT_164562 [Aspergillus karnatakaensis]|uniref:uncharacterized protein n=1 Tax=Aspergillus karnatakaensis TaxID=1810916 RepID=UPI003CCC9A8E